jgi:7,8-dihydro-6-hydroxymethylpterin dimethyltransferase
MEMCVSCGIDFPDALAELAGKAFIIVIRDFRDPYTLNVRQLIKRCVEEITPDGRLIPLCAYNFVAIASKYASSSRAHRFPAWSTPAV